MYVRYRYRIYPTLKQKETLAQWFGCSRKVWNEMLAWTLGHRLAEGRTPTHNEMSAHLTHRIKPSLAYLKDAPAQCLQQTVMDLAQAWNMHFRVPGREIPQFKKRGYRNTIRFAQYTTFDRDSDRLRLPKMQEGVKLAIDRPFPENYTGVTLIRESSGEYYVSVVTEAEEPPLMEISSIDDVLGIDMGITHLAILSDGTKIDNPKINDKTDENIKRKQRRMSTKKKGSRRFRRARLLVSKAMAKARRMRNDYLHKVSRRIVSDPRYKAIACETLRISQMITDAQTHPRCGMGKAYHSDRV